MQLAHRRQLFYLVFPNILHRVERHRRPPEASRVHQCHIVLWVEELTFEGALCVKEPFNHLDCVASFFFNLAHTNDVDQLRRCGDALVVSVHGKRARSKNFSMPRSQMLAQILFNVQVVPLRRM